MTPRKIIVTGAGSGIGLACVRRLRENSHVVAALDIATDALEKAYADDATVVRGHLDAGSPESRRKAVATAADRLGGLDGIIHCAAIWSGTTWDQSDAAEWYRVLSVYLRGSFLIAQAAAEKTIDRGSGSIVLTASDSARVGGVAGGPAYAASKGGVIALTRSLARALGPKGVRVNAINPGVVESAMTRSWPRELLSEAAKRTPLGRIGQPDDIADVACFQASDAARFMTSETVEFNGGFHFD